MPVRRPVALFCVFLALLFSPPSRSQSKGVVNESAAFPSAETLSFIVEWRLIFAGDAQMSFEPRRWSDKAGWEARLNVQSGGLVSKLYKLDDKYRTALIEQFCTTATNLDATEGKRHHEVRVNYDYSRGKATYFEHDLIKNMSKTAESDIPACVTDILGALYKLRTLRLEPGQSAQIPVSDGKKTASARVEAQEREQIKTRIGTFNTVRCEAFVFNGVLFARKAQLQIWLSDDARALPVQVRARMAFPVGSITFTLDKVEQP